MPTITAKDGTQIFYKDWGAKDEQPIVFHHGWPLSSDDWDVQMLFFLAHGYRVAHDRRGHGRSSQVDSGQQYGPLRVRRCADCRVPPLMVKTDNNPACIPIEVFDGFRKALSQNRAQFFLDVALGPFYGFNRPGGLVCRPS